MSRIHRRPPVALSAAAAAVAAAVTCPAALVRAQGLPSPAGAPPQSTVVKGKAPVDKDVLRVKLPRPKEYALPNGARLFVLEDRELPTVSMTVSVRAGDLFEAKRGVASLTASLLTEGTKGRPYAALNEEVERLGAELAASAGSERASVSVSGLSSDTDALVALLADVVLNPAFDPERLQRAQFRSAAALAQQRTDPGFLAGEFTRKLLYGAETPYGRPTVTAEQIRAVTPQDLAAYHSSLYRPEGARIAVAGDVKADEIAAKLRGAFAGWRKAEGAAPELPKNEAKPLEKTSIYVIDRPGSAQTVLSFGNLAISRNDPDFVPLTVANFLLGGNFNSRLNQKLREEKGFTYGASSGVQAPKWVGTWTADAAVRTEVTADAARAFLDEFNRFQKDPVGAEELERAKRAIVGSFALTLESPTAVLERFLTTVEYGLPADYWDTFPRRVEAVTAADVRRVAQKYLGEGRVQLVAVGERSAIEPALSKIGTVTVVPADAGTNPATPPAAPATGTGTGTGGGSATSARGELVSARKVLSVGRQQVEGLLKPYGITPRYGIDWYEVMYRTVDAAGRPTVASGGLLLPSGVAAGTPVPVLSYQHGTLVEKAKAPSAPGLGEAAAVGGLFAAGSGYAVAAADYVGLGKSTVALHPYLVAESEAAACVDMLRATKAAAKQAGVGLSDRLFLAGYSQGGHATMALHRALERDHAGEFKVAASAPMAGPYYLSGVTTSGALAKPAPGGRSTYYAAYLALAYQSAYGDIYGKPSDAFRAPYDAKVTALFDGTKSADAIRAELPATPAELFTPAFIEGVTKKGDHPFVKALQKNDLYDWKPSAPVRLYGGGADKDVPFANSEAAAAKMKANGAASVEAVNVGADKDHGSAFFPSLLAAREWFASFR